MIEAPMSRQANVKFEPTLCAESLYRRWRDLKLERYPRAAPDLEVEVKDPLSLTRTEREALIDRCRRANFVIYRCARPNGDEKKLFGALAQQLGLHNIVTNLRADDDGVSALQVRDVTDDMEYAPYTARALNWHTDGYYNQPNQCIRAFLLYCVRPAVSGGENAFLDTEIAYILLRERNPAWIEALMQSDAMSIPENRQDGVMIREPSTGPVLAVDPQTGCLMMRYTSRRRYIRWKEDEDVRDAVQFLESVLKSDSDWIARIRLESGEGIICNNILHCRGDFREIPGRSRLLYRVRYGDRVAGT